MRWENIDTGKIINHRRYDRLSDEEKKNWKEFDENKVDHADLLNVIGGGLLGDDSDVDQKKTKLNDTTAKQAADV